MANRGKRHEMMRPEEEEVVGVSECYHDELSGWRNAHRQLVGVGSKPMWGSERSRLGVTTQLCLKYYSGVLRLEY